MKALKQILVCIVLVTTIAYAADAERKLVHREEAIYPDLAMRANLHGSIKLKIWISPDGTVRRLEYVGGHPVLAESALKAVKNWKYQAASQESTAVVEVKF